MLLNIILGFSLILLFILVLFWFWTLIHCLFSDLGFKEKVVWVLGMVLFPLLSNVLYLFFINKGFKITKTNFFLGDDKIVAGVCSGLANKLKIDQFYVRIISIILLFISLGVVFIAYLVLWIIMPKKPVKAKTRKKK
jgi:phage shock protein PspC (stress-responsive transcriptional regulator)